MPIWSRHSQNWGSTLTTFKHKPFVVRLNKKQCAAEAKLSKAAQKTLYLIRNGRFYKWNGPAHLDKTSPVALSELVLAGLIVPMPRVETIAVCWVPKGAKPPKMDQFPAGYDYEQGMKTHGR